jgi:hypothetical protein
MDSKGFSSIDFIFSIFLTLIIAVLVLNLIGNDLENEKIMEENINGRLLSDKIANTINQVNSNNIGYINEVDIPKNISGRSFFLTLKRNEVVLSIGNKKTESTLIPTRIISIDGSLLEEFKLYPGDSYEIKKILDKENLTGIQIYRL